MKKVTLFMLLATCVGLLHAQTSPDYIFGNDNGAGWNWTTGTQGTASLGGSYLWQFAATATGNHYFKFGETASNADGQGFWINSTSPDMYYTGGGAKWIAYYNANMGGGGAIYISITEGNYYVVKARKHADDNNIDFAVFDNGAAAPVTISSVTRSMSDNDLTVTATASAAKSDNEKIWLRYSTDNWANSTTTEMTLKSGTSSSYEATLNLASGDFVSYYVFTTINQTSETEVAADADFYTVNYNNNGGKNYTVQIGPFSGNYYIPQGSHEKGFDLLSTAVNNINTNGLTDDVIFYITDNITETINIGLINNSDFTITIRPDQDEDRTITFDKATDNAGPSGAFCLGIGMGLSWADLSPTKNVIIDGYAVGGNTRRLKITTAATHHGGNGPILLMDDCSNIQIKNLIIHHIGATTGSSNYGIYLRVNTSYGTKKMPSNVLIENNEITAIQNTASQGIGIYANADPNSLATGIVIKNNIIKARTRGIFLYYTDDLNIINNEFRINQPSNGMLSTAIMGNKGQTGDINVIGNKFIELKTGNSTAGAYGMRAIIASGGGTWNIINNFFTGFDKTSTTPGETMLQGIRCGSTCIILHNTFYLNELTNKPTYVATPTETQGCYCAINIAAGSPLIKNNIFVSNEDAVYNFATRGTVTVGYSDYNIFDAQAGTTHAGVNSVYPDFSAYQASGVDINSKSISVTLADPSSGDLSLAGTSIDDLNLAAPAIDMVTTDIFGNPRHTPKVYIGAHEPTNLNDELTFTVTVPNGTEHVYIAGSFIGKFWDNTNPFELEPTGNPNEFSGTFPAHSDVEYKYLCEKDDWDYQEAVYVEGQPVSGSNRTYNASDVVDIWYRVKSVTLNVSFEPSVGVPNQLFVKSSLDEWANPTELTKSGSTFTGTLTNDEQKVPANAEYKYYTNEPYPDQLNWECNLDMTPSANRKTIAPVMNDVIERFETRLITGTEDPFAPRLMRTATGIRVELTEPASIELYNINGSLIEKTKATGTYTRELNNGVYIIRINGKSTKFVK